MWCNECGLGPCKYKESAVAPRVSMEECLVGKVEVVETQTVVEYVLPTPNPTITDLYRWGH